MLGRKLHAACEADFDIENARALSFAHPVLVLFAYLAYGFLCLLSVRGNAQVLALLKVGKHE